MIDDPDNGHPKPGEPAGGPLATVVDGGRDTRGRFTPGNTLARGNPFARQVADLRAAMIRAVTPADLAAIVAALVDKAKAGDVVAIREVLDRCIGKATPAVIPTEDDGDEVTLRCPPPRTIGERAEAQVMFYTIVPDRDG